MKRILTLVLCWLISFEAFAISGTNFNFNVGKTSKVAGGYVTSLNKVDGSFENGATGWVASSGTIVPTASTEFQGNFKGVWAGTGTGTLDLQWTATASNTYEASVMFRSPVADSDHYICAYVGTTETGCALVDGQDYTPNTIRTIKVVADSAMSSAFYLRLKHTGTDAFSVEVDDGKIQPWTPEMGQTTITEAVQYKNYTSGTTGGIKFTTKEEGLSDNSKVISDDNSGSYTKFTFIQNSKGTATLNWNSSATTTTFYVRHYNSAGTLLKEVSSGRTSAINSNVPYTFKASAGDYILAAASDIPTTPLNFSITATAIRDNVVTTYSEDSVGEILYSINSTPKNGFISAQGSIIGNTSGTHQGSTYYNLYKYAWTYAVTTAGEPFVISSAKGASYDADWAAGKTIKIDYSGLFPRASGGNAGAVGAKQLDAFQGHYHITKAYGSAPYTGFGYANSNGASTNLSEGSAGTPQVFEPKTDGPSGPPRTSNETRPINSALYAYIRYAVSQPTLLALPTSKIDKFTAKGNASGVISDETVDWINGNCTYGSSSWTCNFNSNLFSIAPTCEIQNSASSVSGGTGITSVSTSSITFVIWNSGSGSQQPFNLVCHRSGSDYTAPGVFVGNVAKNQVAIIQYRGNGTRTTLSNTHVAMPLTTVKGDSTIVSIASNQFTLQAGEYEIESFMNLGLVSGDIYSYLFNITDSQEIDRLPVASGQNGSWIPMKSSVKISTSSLKSFELRAYTNSGGNGLIGTNSPYPNDLNGFIKITKLNGQ